MAKPDEYDLIIVGGSFAGLALALALAQSGSAWRIAIVEREAPGTARDRPEDVRAVALTAGAKALLGALGVWPAIAPNAQPVARIEITDTALGDAPRLPRLSFASEGEVFASITENATLRAALFEAVSAVPDITLIAPASVVAMEAGSAKQRVMLSTGAAVSAQLLVAADGQRSALRAMAGIATVEWRADQAGIVAALRCELPHDGVALQHFLPAGPFAALPMTDDRISLVWTERRADAARLVGLPPEAFVAAAEQRLGGHLGQLRLLNRPAAYPLTMTLARQFIAPRLALIGDAAHALHWLAGQGLNHALKDVAALAESLADARHLGFAAGDAAALERYQRWRRFDATTAAIGSAMLNRVFRVDNVPARAVRDFGLGMIDRVGPLKRLMMREAAGQTGPAPALWRGVRLHSPEGSSALASSGSMMGTPSRMG